MNKYNKYFSLDSEIGNALTEKEFQCLLADGKIYTTKCRMNGIEASKAMNKPLSDFELEERTYAGKIVAGNLKEAEQIAKQREFGEEIEGVLCGIIPFNSEMINPYDTSKNKN